MKMRLHILFIVTALFTGIHVFSQKTPSIYTIKNSVYNDGLFSGYTFIKGDSIYIIGGSLAGVCKDPGTLKFRAYSITHLKPPVTVATYKSPYLKIHGNVLYNFNYRSYIDTPFAQNDLMQHLLQTNFQVLVKDKYPLTVTVSGRSSNSPYFKNTLDVNLRFNRGQLMENIKTDLKNNILSVKNTVAATMQKGEPVSPDRLSKFAHVFDLSQLTQYQQTVKNELIELNQLQSWIKSSSRLQEIVEEKENLLSGGGSKDRPEQKNIQGLLNKTGSFITELVGKSVEEKGLKKLVSASPLKQRLDSATRKEEKLKKNIQDNVARLTLEGKKIDDSINNIRKEINGLSNGPALYAFMRKYNIDKGQLSKTQKLLLSVNQIGLGRTYVDYSELTVKNISIGGVNIEMNPLPFYFAFAAGKVNYRARDFIYKTGRNNLPSQAVAIFRAGIGQKQKNNLIFSFYNGKKSVLNASPLPDINSIQKVLGVSAEGKFGIDANNYIIAEVAKSSYYISAGQQPTSAGLTSKAFNFKDRSNEAYSIKLFSQIPSTGTKVTGYYKKLGERFQSFTLYPSAVNQEAWLARISQNLWKKRVSFDAAIRKNDFVSPLAAPSFNSKTVFKSLQFMARIPKYPIVSVGYYPSSQLLLTNDDVLMESQYNTLNAVISHNYQFKKIAMNTNSVFTRFYNNSTDTGFIYFNARSWTLNQSVFLGKCIIQTSAGLTDQSDLNLFTLEQTFSWQAHDNFSFNGSIKWNRFNKKENLFGATAGINLHIRKLGSLQFNYEKTYLPGEDRNLKPVDLGRMSFYREF